MGLLLSLTIVSGQSAGPSQWSSMLINRAPSPDQLSEDFYIFLISCKKLSIYFILFIFYLIWVESIN